MKIHGNRVYLNMPNLPEYRTELTPELKKEIQQQMAREFDKLTVFASGVDHIKAGEVVCVDAPALQKARIVKIGESEKLVVSSFDIMHTWGNED